MCIGSEIFSFLFYLIYSQILSGNTGLHYDS